MASRELKVLIQTPDASVVEAGFDAARVPTRTGQVGLRPDMEPLVLVVEPGLVVLRRGDDTLYVGTGGGILDVSASGARLLTPFAIQGASPDDVLAELDAHMGTPSSELLARRRLGELEERILEQLKQQPPRTQSRKGIRYG